MAGISGAGASARGRVRALDHRLSDSSPLASPVPALADVSATQIEDGAYACLELPPNGEARLSTMQSTGPSALGGSRATTRTAVVPRTPATSRRLPPLGAHLADIQEADETGLSINADLEDTRARNEQGFTPASSDSVFPSPPAMMVTPIVRRAPLQTAWQGAAWKYTLYSDKHSVHKSTERKRGRRGGVNNKKTPPPSTRPPTRTTPEALALRETRAPRPTSPPLPAQDVPLSAPLPTVLEPSSAPCTTSLVAPGASVSLATTAVEPPEIVDDAPQANTPSDPPGARGSESDGVSTGVTDLDVSMDGFDYACPQANVQLTHDARNIDNPEARGGLRPEQARQDLHAPGLRTHRARGHHGAGY